jgi:HD-GYP domain-containing protein (c-di-GMP phosphodiesterase class II)
MARFTLRDISSDVLIELQQVIAGHVAIAQRLLMDMEQQPVNGQLVHDQLVHELFRTIDMIKGDLGVVGVAPLVPLIESVEGVLGRLRHGEIAFSAVLSDLLILILERVCLFVSDCSASGRADYDPALFEKMVSRLEAAYVASPEQMDYWLGEAIQLLDPSVVIQPENSHTRMNETENSLVYARLLENEDMHFFRTLMQPIEQRSHYWQGRGDRILKFSLLLNQIAGEPVDNKQLAMAACIHDYGMALLPLSILHKRTALRDEDIHLLRSHVTASAHLLQYLPQWQPAREMVLQHHESVDGSGYPFGLRDREICDGAKILAIVDTFDALTHERAHLTHQRRPIIRAVKEINDLAGRQLNAFWVDVFNKAVEPVIVAHHSQRLPNREKSV